ncbi:MAG: archaeosine biosynthesis radical SAM protein RaSEA [Thermoplasmata archaeon]|nr:archaeosine biosynthesis radical SAM protein RaSEA [Thermoplasmata archaeon]
MTESVARTIARDRRPSREADATADRYVNLWREAEAIGTTRVDAFVLILRTRGCYWADQKGCSMCGYAKDTLGRSATPEELGTQIDQALLRYRGEPYVKVYTSGSFLDDREVDPSSRRRLISAFEGRATRFLFESLPEFVTESTVGELRDVFHGDLEIALGLESTQPDVLLRLVHKNAPPKEYLDGADRVRQFGAHPKGYLLLKPPYLTEDEAIRDVLTSIRVASPKFDTLSVNPVHIQNGTVVEWLFRRGRYRPPWLWSVVEVLRDGSRDRHGARLVSFPTAGGLPRGPRNCGRCDRTVLAAIEAASLDQAWDALDELDCACRATWKTQRALEPLGADSS